VLYLNSDEKFNWNIGSIVLCNFCTHLCHPVVILAWIGPACQAGIFWWTFEQSCVVNVLGSWWLSHGRSHKFLWFYARFDLASTLFLLRKRFAHQFGNSDTDCLHCQWSQNGAATATRAFACANEFCGPRMP